MAVVEILKKTTDGVGLRRNEPCLYQIRASNKILKESLYLALVDILKKTTNAVGLGRSEPCLYQIRGSNKILEESLYLALVDVLKKKTTNAVGFGENCAVSVPNLSE